MEGAIMNAERFTVRLEAYWQSIAIYAVTLIIYVIGQALWNSTLQLGLVNVVLTDPIVALLGTFVLVALIAVVVNTAAKRSIVISDDGITYVSRFHERTFNVQEIERIAMGGDRRMRVRGVFAVIRIYIKGRRRPLRVRPGLYENDAKLIERLVALRTQVAARG
jgi:hypothetical protein